MWLRVSFGHPEHLGSVLPAITLPVRQCPGSLLLSLEPRTSLSFLICKMEILSLVPLPPCERQMKKKMIKRIL